VRLEKSGEAGQDLTDWQQKIAALTSSTDPVDHAVDIGARDKSRITSMAEAGHDH
jgi:hypothetical protein